MTVGIFWCQNARSTYISVVCGGFLHLSTARFLSSLAARSLHLGFQNGRRPILQFTPSFHSLIANETGERKREPVSAAGYRAVRSSRAMQKKSQIFQVDFRVIRFRQWYFFYHIRM